MEEIKKEEIIELINLALREDLAGYGDITTKYLLPEGHTSSAYIICKQKGSAVLCGIDIASYLLTEVDTKIKVEKLKDDAEKINTGDKVIAIKGPTASLLKAERPALNFLQHLSGIATLTSKFSSIASKYGIKIVDTRKTKPGLRKIEKYAVRCGGGYNHRFGLFDGIMLKDNHIRAAGGLAKAVEKIRRKIPHTLKIEVEVQNFRQLDEAIESKADIIMLDNMDKDQISEATSRVREKARKGTIIEVSGNVTLKNLEAICATNVDLISSGYITHSAEAVDFSMEFK
ncbi:MAG: carboxylating nicotinate-nucleotide diphosphorylase [Actinomycetota bacterium]